MCCLIVDFEVLVVVVCLFRLGLFVSRFLSGFLSRVRFLARSFLFPLFCSPILRFRDHCVFSARSCAHVYVYVRRLAF